MLRNDIIMLLVLRRNKVYDVCGNWLEPFSHCKNLTKFTLADVRVSKSGFVSSVQLAID